VIWSDAVKRLAFVVTLVLAALGAASATGGERLDGPGWVSATIPTEGDPAHLAFGEGALWVTTYDDELLRIDPETNAVVTSVSLSPNRAERWLGVGQSGVWFSNFDDGTVSRVDPETNRVVATIPVQGNPTGIGFSPGAVWVGNERGSSVARIDPRTNTVVAVVRLGRAGNGGPQAIAFGAGSVWVTVPGASRLVRIDPLTNAVVARIPARMCAIAVGRGAVWGDSCGGNRLLQVSARTNEVVTSVEVRGSVRSVQVGYGAVWATTRGGRSFLVRVESRRVSGRLALGGYAPGRRLAIGAGAVWVGDKNGVLRIQPTGGHGCEPRLLSHGAASANQTAVSLVANIDAAATARSAWPTRAECH